MRILLFDNTQMICREGRMCCVDGTGKFAKELVGLGHEVTMFGQNIIDPASISNFDIEANGIKTQSYRRGKIKVWDYLKLYFHALIAAFKSDFVYLFYPTSYSYFILLCRLFGIKYGLYIRGTVGVESRVSKMIYKGASLVCTVSDVFTDKVNSVNKKGVAHTIKPMTPYSEKDIIDRDYKTPERFNIMILCRIEKEKGISELLNAIAHLKHQAKDRFHLNIVGDGGYLAESKKIVEDLGINEEVSFIGAVNDKVQKQKWFEDSDIYILPTYHEGFPRTLYEAMIYGTPIITTLVGGIPALMKDGVNCLAIEKQSVDSIVSKLRYAMEHYEEMIQYALTAKETVYKVVDSHRPTHAQDVDNAIRGFNKR